MPMVPKWLLCSFPPFSHHKPNKNISETFALRPAPGPGSWREFGPCQRYQDTLKYHVFIWLVVYLPLWKIWKSVGIIIPNIWKNKKCSKPPTSYRIFCGLRSSVPSDFPCPKTLKARPGMRRQLPNTFTSDRNPSSSQVLPCFRKSGGFDVGITGKHGTFHS